MTDLALELYKRLGEVEMFVNDVLFKYIDDQNNPLELRWELFTKIPSTYLVQDRWVPDFNFGLGELLNYDDGPFYPERKQVFYMVDLIQDLPLNMANFQAPKGMTIDEFVVALKEEVIAKRLYSFTFDW